jgi:hypothetical protein
MKCDGCGLQTGVVYTSAVGKLIAKPSSATRCAACKTLVALRMHPKLKA